MSEGGFPPARQGSGPRCLCGSLPIFLRFAPCRPVPSAPAVLDCPPPAFGGFQARCAQKHVRFFRNGTFFISERRRVVQWLPLPLPLLPALTSTPALPFASSSSSNRGFALGCNLGTPSMRTAGSLGHCGTTDSPTRGSTFSSFGPPLKSPVMLARFGLPSSRRRNSADTSKKA